jgi:3-polyprenyl-4-hydroxybenzoate decarboxylase
VWGLSNNCPLSKRKTQVSATDVVVKEKRKVVFMVREWTLLLGHLALMPMAANMDAHILPENPILLTQAENDLRYHS